jgi:hypothetical protein
VKAKSKYKPDQTPAYSKYDAAAIDSVIDGIMATQQQYEDKWGVGRLELLVDDELRLKFRDQYNRFNDAVMEHDVALVRVRGAAMNRAWVALDQAATAAGALPLDPEVWEIELPDGRVIAFCRHLHDSFHVARSGRHIEIWTPEEIVRVITAYPEIALAKDVFPGATVVSIKPKRLEDAPEPDYLDSLEEEEY